MLIQSLWGKAIFEHAQLKVQTLDIVIILLLHKEKLNILHKVYWSVQYMCMARITSCFAFFAVSVTWNGTMITGPVLIYHDEILLDNMIEPTVENSDDPGDLVCRSSHHEEARWRRSNGVTVPTSGDYRRVQSHAGLLPSLSRLSTTDPQYNGLWVCVLFINASTVDGLSDQDLIDSFVYVGIYNKNSGELTDIFLRLTTRQS